MTGPPWQLSADRCFDPNPAQRRVARALYESIADLPIVSPHGHVDPRLFSDPSATFGSPADLLITPDHYVYRLLYSHGISLERLGIGRIGSESTDANHREVWRIFSEHFHLFRGTPTGLWLAQVLVDVFGVTAKPSAANAQSLFDELAEKLRRPEYAPRALYERFNIEVLCTTDAATDSLDAHREILASGWPGNVRPTFRSDAIVDVLRPGWRQSITGLERLTGVDIGSFAEYVDALERRRETFKALGAVATDQSVEDALAVDLGATEADRIFQKALDGTVSEDDGRAFTAHMLMELARMSVDDGLVMQLHVGSIRNYDKAILSDYGRDRGFDIPHAAELARGLRPLLNRHGRDRRLTLIVFTLDESTYSRELAPLAGVYPALKVGPPWWFHDSIEGMARFRRSITETAGLHNTVGFNDDTRAFPSIPARHDLARRVDANWLAGLVVRGIIDEEDAADMALDVAYRLAKRAYKLDGAMPRSA